jgi:hypothetical protein
VERRTKSIEQSIKDTDDPASGRRHSALARRQEAISA